MIARSLIDNCIAGAGRAPDPLCLGQATLLGGPFPSTQDDFTAHSATDCAQATLHHMPPQAIPARDWATGLAITIRDLSAQVDCTMRFPSLHANSGRHPTSARFEPLPTSSGRRAGTGRPTSFCPVALRHYYTAQASSLSRLIWPLRLPPTHPFDSPPTLLTVLVNPNGVFSHRRAASTYYSSVRLSSPLPLLSGQSQATTRSWPSQIWPSQSGPIRHPSRLHPTAGLDSMTCHVVSYPDDPAPCDNSSLARTLRAHLTRFDYSWMTTLFYPSLVQPSLATPRLYTTPNAPSHVGATGLPAILPGCPSPYRGDVSSHVLARTRLALPRQDDVARSPISAGSRPAPAEIEPGASHSIQWPLPQLTSDLPPLLWLPCAQAEATTLTPSSCIGPLPHCSTCLTPPGRVDSRRPRTTTRPCPRIAVPARSDYSTSIASCTHASIPDDLPCHHRSLIKTRRFGSRRLTVPSTITSTPGDVSCPEHVPAGLSSATSYTLSPLVPSSPCDSTSQAWSIHTGAGQGDYSGRFPTSLVQPHGLPHSALDRQYLATPWRQLCPRSHRLITGRNPATLRHYPDMAMSSQHGTIPGDNACHHVSGPASPFRAIATSRHQPNGPTSARSDDSSHVSPGLLEATSHLATCRYDPSRTTPELCDIPLLVSSGQDSTTSRPRPRQYRPQRRPTSHLAQVWTKRRFGTRQLTSTRCDGPRRHIAAPLNTERHYDPSSSCSSRSRATIHPGREPQNSRPTSLNCLLTGGAAFVTMSVVEVGWVGRKWVIS